MRPDVDEYFMSMAMLVSSRASCARRKVGCVLVDRHNYVLATGYNGVARGLTHCTTTPCAGATARSGEGLVLCEAIHAEQNALLQCRDKEAIAKAYCTTAPCVYCTKLLLNTGCQEVIFLEDYPHAKASERLWRQAVDRPVTWRKIRLEHYHYHQADLTRAGVLMHGFKV